MKATECDPRHPGTVIARLAACCLLAVGSLAGCAALHLPDRRIPVVTVQRPPMDTVQRSPAEIDVAAFEAELGSPTADAQQTLKVFAETDPPVAAPRPDSPPLLPGSGSSADAL